MFFSFVDELRAAGIPASMKEHLVLLEALDADIIGASPEQFYFLARATFVKDEGLLDRFDQVFGKVFKGLEADYGTDAVPIPEEWLKKVAELYLSPEEMAKIRALGSWEEIMEALKATARGAAGTPPGRHQMDRNRRHLAVRRLWLQSRGHPDRPGRRPQPERDQGLGQARVQEPRQPGRARHPQHQGRSAPPAGASPARAPPTSSTSTRRSTAPPARAGSTSTCGPSGTMR